jgi:hypothetical protein
MKNLENKKIDKNSKKSLVCELENSIKKFVDKIDDGFVYPLIIPPIQQINEEILFEIYPHLKKIKKQKILHVLLYSYGGDAHTAFHIGRLLQGYSDLLNIYILREAKSAATLISSAADTIIFSEISELGPMDPQIHMNGIDFSPLAIKHTFDLLQQQSEEKHDQIVKVLTDKLPDPLILGELLKSLETGKDYLYKLMKDRMFIDNDDKAIEIAEKLVMGYPDHGYCIDFNEAKNIGLKVKKVDTNYETEILKIMKNYKNVWDKFDFHVTRAKNAGEDNTKQEKIEFDEAFALYKELKKLASEIINYQQPDKN